MKAAMVTPAAIEQKYGSAMLWTINPITHLIVTKGVTSGRFLT
jgi:hypothetical protein